MICQRHQTAVRLAAAEKATVARLPESTLPRWVVQSDTARGEAAHFQYSDVVERRPAERHPLRAGRGHRLTGAVSAAHWTATELNTGIPPDFTCFFFQLQ